MPFILVTHANRYLVSREFGEPKRGNHASIYFCLDLATRTRLALKALFTRKVDNERHAMIAEMQLYVKLQRMASGNLLTPVMHEFGTMRLDGLEHPMFIMECLGEDLSAALNVEPARAFAWGVQLVSALQGLHKLGQIHSSIKPENLCRVSPRAPWTDSSTFSESELEGLVTRRLDHMMPQYFGVPSAVTSADPSAISDCIAHAQQWGEVRLIDFGGSEPIGEEISYKEHSRAWLFCSRRAHGENPCRPTDDLEALAYSLLEVCRNGRLPWAEKTAVATKQACASKNWEGVFTNYAGVALGPLEQFMRTLSTMDTIDDAGYLALSRILSPPMASPRGPLLLGSTTGRIAAQHSSSLSRKVEELVGALMTVRKTPEEFQEQECRGAPKAKLQALVRSVDRVVQEAGFAIICTEVNHEGASRKIAYTVGLSVTFHSCSELLVFDHSTTQLRTLVAQCMALAAQVQEPQLKTSHSDDSCASVVQAKEPGAVAQNEISGSPNNDGETLSSGVVTLHLSNPMTGSRIEETKRPEVASSSPEARENQQETISSIEPNGAMLPSQPVATQDNALQSSMMTAVSSESQNGILCSSETTAGGAREKQSQEQLEVKETKSHEVIPQCGCEMRVGDVSFRAERYLNGESLATVASQYCRLYGVPFQLTVLCPLEKRS